MDKVLAVAEQLIETSASEDTKTKYIQSKNRILFGSLAPIVTRYQTENHGMQKEIESMEEAQSMTLQDLTERTITDMIVGLGKEPESWTLDGLCTSLICAVGHREKQIRQDIERFRSNKVKYEQKIEEKKHQELPPPTKYEGNIDASAKALAEVQMELKEVTEQIRDTTEQNIALMTQNKMMASQIKSSQPRVSELCPRKSELEVKVENMTDTRNQLIQQLTDATNRVVKTKLTQRFGTSIMASNNSKAERLLQLRKEVDRLTALNASLEQQKKTLMIAQIRDIQRSGPHDYIPTCVSIRA